jgi:hypothetical protein
MGASKGALFRDQKTTLSPPSHEIAGLGVSTTLKNPLTGLGPCFEAHPNPAVWTWFFIVVWRQPGDLSLGGDNPWGKISFPVITIGNAGFSLSKKMGQNRIQIISIRLLENYSLIRWLLPSWRLIHWWKGEDHSMSSANKHLISQTGV